ncbi:MAG: asparagine synthase (glutamine-hydrolyzing) [Deltaproteobacteria bacterium]|nr:asparagine synthase (glutamine-hydrolyzing) [Deltaproteobacteria bacterium]
MCGICGTAGFGDPDMIRNMAHAMIHRGPDEEGFFESNDPPLFLANRRLSIIDVEGGKQPVFSEDWKITAVQNGEIYNFLDLRKELEGRGHNFRSRTDSEVIPHLYEEYGEEFPRHLDGMFAIALWDSASRKLLLIRDQMGIKPLYVWEDRQCLAFASEVKALLKTGRFDAERELDSLHFLLNIRFIPGEKTLFKGVRKLLPATTLVWQRGKVREKKYWELSPGPDRRIRTPADCVEETRRLLRAAVSKQLVSDVPLGLYLSGGIDSSSLVAMAASTSPEMVKTYSLGFGEPTDELSDSRLVAETFDTDHHETTISFDALSVFPKVTWHVEEPKENAIQLYLLSRYASRHVKVALSGLGGDELFGGYRIFDYLRPMVLPERLAGRRLNSALLWPMRNLLNLIVGNLGSMKYDFAKRGLDFVLSAGVSERGYLILRNMWEHDNRLFKAVYTPEARKQIERGVESFFTPYFKSNGLDSREDVLRAEFRFKMVDDFLLNEDRTSMANSLEVRVPFLDKDLVEFAFSIPASVKFAGGLKTVLKEAMADILPEKTLVKPKWGFTFDSYYQFQKDLRELAGRELTGNFIRDQGIFNYSFIRGILEHPPHRWMRWHYFLLWLILGTKVWEDLFVRGKKPEDCYD